MYYGCKKEIRDRRDYKAYVCSFKPDILPDEYEITATISKQNGQIEKETNALIVLQTLVLKPISAIL